MMLPMMTDLRTVVNAATITLTFSYQGGKFCGNSNTTTVKNLTVGETFYSQKDADKWYKDPTKTGYTFRGWYTQDNGQGQKIEDLHNYIIPSTATTLYAHWVEVYEIQFVRNNSNAKFNAVATSNYCTQNGVSKTRIYKIPADVKLVDAIPTENSV